MQKGNYPHLNFAHKYYFTPGQQTEWRYCYTNSIQFSETGYGEVRFHDSTLALSPGSLLYIPAGTLHRLSSDISQPLVAHCAYFDWNYMGRSELLHENDYFCNQDAQLNEEWVEHDKILSIPLHTKVPNNKIWLNYFEEFTSSPEILDTAHFPDFLKIHGHFLIFLHFFHQFISKEYHFMDPRIKAILDWVEHCAIGDGYQGIEAWAGKFGLSRTHFHSIFKKATGHTPRSYWNNHIMKKVRNDLKFSSLTITEIAEKYNFSSVHYFSALFRKYTGETPSSYRNKNKLY